MSNELMAKEVSFEVNGEPVKLTGNTVKNFLTRGNEEVSNQEVVMFINLCKYQKLNPFLNEAYLIKFKGSPAQIIVGKEALMKKAEANTNYDGMEAGIIIQRGDQILELDGSFCLKGDVLLGGWAKIYRKDRAKPFVAKVDMNEYNKGKSTWNQIPKTMIRKTAIVQAMREAFPVELGAMYTEEEQIAPITNEQVVHEEIKQNANTEIIDVEPIKPEKVEIIDAKDFNPSKEGVPKETAAVNNGGPDW